MDPRDLGTVNSDLATGRYGGAGASAAWETVLDLYNKDRLREAYEFALALGAGDAAFGTYHYRMVEAEWRAREYGIIRTIGDQISVEAPRNLTEEGWADLLDAVREEFADVCRRLEFDPQEKVMVSLMVAESDAPWTPYRHGAFIDKIPYDKVILPVGLFLDSDADFREGLRHEFAHLANLTLSGGRMGMWLEEAIAMAIGGRADSRYLRELRKNPAIWMDARGLNSVFTGDRRAGGQRALWRAYEQAGVIGRYLVAQKGEAALGQLARGFDNNSTWKDLAMRITGQTGEDEALKEVFGFSESELFSRALAWAAGQ